MDNNRPNGNGHWIAFNQFQQANTRNDNANVIYLNSDTNVGI